MKIVFYSSRIQFDGDFLEKQGLGGSESALINISTSLAKLQPDEVVVYNGNNKREFEFYNGVRYKTANDFQLDVKTMNADAFIVLREISPFRLPYIDSKLKICWSQDDMEEVDLIKLQKEKYTRKNVDLFLAVSNHSLNSIKSGFPEKEVIVQRNGYRSDWINESYINYNFPNAIYTSTPFRGLNILANCWGEIYGRCCYRGITPTLKVCTGMSLYQQPENNFIELYNYLKSLPGVEFIGAVCQKELYKELQKCKVMLYSNSFRETSCMSVLEALANNLWVVTTDLGALGEQVKDKQNGFLIKGDAHSEEYQREFIDKAVISLCDPVAPDSRGLIFSWDEQAEKMRDVIKYKLKGDR